MEARNARDEVRDRLHLLLDASAATRAWRSQLAEQVAACEVTDQEFFTLWLCAEAPAGCRGQGDLAGALGVSAAQMSGLVERLRQRGLLQVERLGNDRRRQVWMLTSAGITLLTHALHSLAANGEFRGWLSPAEIALLQTLIKRCTPDQGGPSSCAA
jgi:DNA-binding MarR family transcriptional regulator